MDRLTLQNFCGGELAKQFEALYPDLIARCKSGEKCSVSIGITFERVADTATMVRSSYTQNTTTPGYGRASLCVMDADFGLKTEPPEEIPQPVSLFKVEGGKANG